MRVDGWPRMLNRYILDAQTRYRETGFQAGSFDCVHFVADWVWYSTLKDPLGVYRGAYKTEAEGFAMIAEREGSLFEALRARFGEPIHPSKGQRGDIAYAEFPDVGPACGILFTSGARMRALFLAERGFAMHRARDMHHAFQVR